MPWGVAKRECTSARCSTSGGRNSEFEKSATICQTSSHFCNFIFKSSLIVFVNFYFKFIQISPIFKNAFWWILVIFRNFSNFLPWINPGVHKNFFGAVFLWKFLFWTLSIFKRGPDIRIFPTLSNFQNVNFIYTNFSRVRLDFIYSTPEPKNPRTQEPSNPRTTEHKKKKTWE